MFLLVKAVTLPPTIEVLTLLNVKPTVIITTVGNDGSTNAAPFSWFSIVDYNPPQVLFSTNLKRDTYRNVLETKEFVINFPSVRLLRQIWVTSKHFPYGVNELEKADLTGFPSEKVKPPRIRECKAHIECRVVWTKPIGSSCLVLGEIVSVSVDGSIEGLKTKNMLIELNPPLYFSFRQNEKTREWMFTELGKIHRIIERDGEVKVTSEKRASMQDATS